MSITGISEEMARLLKSQLE